MESGDASGTFEGKMTREMIDVAIKMSLKNLQASGQGAGVMGLGGGQTSQIFEALKELDVTIRVVGPVTEPRLAFDVEDLDKQFKNALVAAGKDKLMGELDKKVGGQLKEAGGELGERAKESAGKLLDGLFGGSKEEE